MSPQFALSLSQEDQDMKEYFEKLHSGQEETLSLWQLSKNKEPPTHAYDWTKAPSCFETLWRDGKATKFKIGGPRILTNLFGRTPAEVFADFPTDFPDSPRSSPPTSPASLCSSLSDEGSEVVHDRPASVKEQFSIRMHLESDDSPPSSPIVPCPLTPSLPPSPTCPSEVPTTCNPLTLMINPPSQNISPSPSSTLIGTDSRDSSPKLDSSPSIAASSPTCFSTTPLSMEHTVDDVAKQSSVALAPQQIVLEERQDPPESHGTKRAGDSVDAETTRPPKKKKTPPSEIYRCEEPGCFTTCSRKSDLRRHVKNQHNIGIQIGDAVLCQRCGLQLSRADSARRHESREACGKRAPSTLKKKTRYMKRV
ncbi:hypothetical protein R3P38DRAFT_2841484 [Favolaschia claudopus]|uniref:C2H2-type domain-containing protein n=1 Tax=Favolaschia claudopus TaxID=2862362 RepID=A0AAW0E1N7_9AGAR